MPLSWFHNISERIIKTTAVAIQKRVEPLNVYVIDICEDALQACQECIENIICILIEHLKYYMNGCTGCGLVKFWQLCVVQHMTKSVCCFQHRRFQKHWKILSCLSAELFSLHLKQQMQLAGENSLTLFTILFTPFVYRMLHTHMPWLSSTSFNFSRAQQKKLCCVTETCQPLQQCPSYTYVPTR